MSLSEMRAVLRFAPVYDPRILEVPGLARDLMVQPGALETVGLDEATPVVIDHDMDRQVGTVREIYIAPSVDAGHVPEWFYASCDFEGPPGWLRAGGGVSWSHIPLRTQDVNGTTRLLRGVIKEISILTPSTRPAEGLAQVAWIGSPAASTTSDRAVAGEVIYGKPGERIVRYFKTPITVR